MEIIYRRLLPKDSQQYRNLRLQSLKVNPESFGSTFEEESSTQKLAFELCIEQQTSNKFILGAYDYETLIGICGLAQETQTKTKHKAAIIQMYVRHNYRGKGVGSQLLLATIKEAKRIPELEQLVLGVVTENKSAVRMYEKIGFQEYGFQKEYFKVGDTYYDQKLMVLYLKW